MKYFLMTLLTLNSISLFANWSAYDLGKYDGKQSIISSISTNTDFKPPTIACISPLRKPTAAERENVKDEIGENNQSIDYVNGFLSGVLEVTNGIQNPCKQ